TSNGSYFLAAHSQSTGPKRFEVFGYRQFDDQDLSTLVGEIARIRIFRIRDFTTGSLEDVNIDMRNARPVLDSARADEALNVARGAFSGFLLDNIWALDTGEKEQHTVSVQASPSFTLNRILTPFGSFASTLIWEILSIIGVFAALELVAVISSAKLTHT